MKICVPVMAADAESALAKLERALAVADVVELRLDRIGGPDLPALLRKRKQDILVTHRRWEEGGGFNGSEKERLERLVEAARLGAGFVDIEAATEDSLIAELRAAIAKGGGATKLIVSRHDLERTPGERALRTMVDQGLSLGADVVKIVTQARTMEDNLRVLGLIPYAGKKGAAAIAFCMGEKGRVSRLMAPLLGSFLTFASLEEGDASAPGQFTVGEMREFLKKFEGHETFRV